jgi:hypothetical protein
MPTTITLLSWSVAILRGTGQGRTTRKKKRLPAALSRRFCNRMSCSARCSSTARYSR